MDGALAVEKQGRQQYQRRQQDISRPEKHGVNDGEDPVHGFAVQPLKPNAHDSHAGRCLPGAAKCTRDVNQGHRGNQNAEQREPKAECDDAKQEHDDRERGRQQPDKHIVETEGDDAPCANALESP